MKRATGDQRVPSSFGVIDLFAGPGGLNEGFAGLTSSGFRPFETVISVEMDAAAHATLRLRAFLRAHLSREGAFPSEYAAFHRNFDPPAGAGLVVPDWSADPLWAQSENEARCLTLGTSEARLALGDAIASAKKRFDDTVVIGGPPCQAYSLVGRARNRGVRGYRAEDDHRHFLFREYIAVLKALHPAVFVMENVKGMLSSSVGGRRVYDMLMEDLRSLGGEEGELYELVPLAPRTMPADAAQAFVIEAENHGVPQRRHRVIILGIRHDVAACWRSRGGGSDPALLRSSPRATVRHLLGGFPEVRSGLSKEEDDPDRWAAARRSIADRLSTGTTCQRHGATLLEALGDLPRRARGNARLARMSTAAIQGQTSAPNDLISFLTGCGFQHVAQHQTRAHIRTDLARYMFAAAVAESTGVSPKARDFPPELAPRHESWGTGKFDDRFRVQVWDEPSTTITSHIAKDGHYFIHPDPMQCRSLTVREAARLQTFPDDYLFLGNRTQQYVQVGNAVPPFLARQIAEVVLDILGR